MDIASIPNVLTNGNSTSQKEALAVFDSLKDNPNGWRLCLEGLSNPGIDESRSFFCFLVIENYIKTRYEQDTAENQVILRQFLVAWFSRPSSESNFILNKFAQVTVTVFLIDFPARRWPRFFQEFIALCNNERAFQLFLKILLQINADIADRELNRSQKEVENGTFIKDLMRETCLLDLAQLWFRIIENCHETNAPLVCSTLEVVAAYVSWIDITLVTNECFMSRLFSLFDKKAFRCSVCDTFGAILHKGMDPLTKTTMVEQFMNVETIKDKIGKILSGTEPDLDEEFMVKLSKLANTIGIELIESFKKSKAKNIPNDQLMIISEAIHAKYPMLCFFLSNTNPLVSLQIHPFTREYIQFLKRIQVSEDKVSEVISVLSKIIIDKSRYPTNYDFDVDEHCTNFDECRKSCRVLFENLLCLNLTSSLRFVCDDLVAPILTNWQSLTSRDFSQVEVALYMFFLLGENSPSLSNHHKKLEEILCHIISSNVSSFPHFTIQIIYFDIVTRYDKLLTGSALVNYVPLVLVSFLDERGFKHPNHRVRSKSCQFFNRFIKGNLKGKVAEKIQAFAEEIIKRLHDLLQLDVHSTNQRLLTDEDQLVLYETIATLIITNYNYDSIKKHLYLKSFLIEPLWKTFEELFGLLQSMTYRNGTTNGPPTNNTSTRSPLSQMTHLVDKISHCIFLVTRTSKAFSSIHPIKSINAQSIYLDSFNMFVKALSLDVGVDNLATIQSAVRQLLHRLIVCLEESEILPLLPLAIEKIFLPCSRISNSNYKTIQELIPLINQVVTKFKHSWMFQRDILPFLKQIFMPLISSIFSLTSSDILSSDEVTSLQKCYYSFLSVLSSNNVFEVFTSLEPNVLDQILLTIVKGSVEFPDSSTQKMCFGILKKMIELFGSNQNGSVLMSDNDNSTQAKMISSTFVDFIYKNVVPACFYAPLRVADSVQDGNQLINECVSCLKAVEAVRGSTEVASYVQGQLFHIHFPSIPENEKNEFLHAYSTGDIKAIKEAMKKLMISARKT